jgi:hypothetical protein
MTMRQTHVVMNEPRTVPGGRRTRNGNRAPGAEEVVAGVRRYSVLMTWPRAFSHAGNVPEKTANYWKLRRDVKSHAWSSAGVNGFAR